MKTLFTCEKPDQAKKYAEILGVPTKNLGGYFENEQYVITWAFGHMIGLKYPEEINKDFEKWSLEPLPFDVPDLSKDLKIDKTKSKQIDVIKKLINRKDIDRVINGGDADREGLLIQEELYDFSKCSKPIYVLWSQSLEKDEIMRCMANLKERKEFINILNSAKARECLDWMYGMSYSRANKMIFYPYEKSVVSYGRCQTPLLKLIADRDKEIKDFVVNDYFQVEATFNKGYKGILINTDNEYAKFDKKDEAQDIINNLKAKNGSIIEYKSTKKKKTAPNLFSLSTLQNEMGSIHHLTLDETLKTAQSLYEKQLTSYPRTDTEYINDEVFGSMENSLKSALVYVKPDTKLNSFEDIKKKICQPKKVEGHHAIIPTKNICSKEKFEQLTDNEKLVYLAICNRLVAVLMPDYEYESIEIITEIENNKFKITGTKSISMGWKSLYENQDKIDKMNNKDEIEEEQKIPDNLKQGDSVNAINLDILAKKTEAPKRYTIATLSKLMEKYNIGRPATRAEIVETLIHHKYISFNKNKYQTTDFGYEYVNKLPLNMVDPKITADMEDNLTAIVEGKLDYKDFLNNAYELQKKQISELKEYAKTLPQNTTHKALENSREKDVIGKCPFCNSDMVDSNPKAFSHIDYKTNKCPFVIWKSSLFTTITKSMAKKILSDGKVEGNFKTKDGKIYKRYIVINKEEKKLELGDTIK